MITTEEGVERVEKVLGWRTCTTLAVDLVHHLDVALRAKELYQRDVDYLLDHGEVKIVDEFTGRVLEGRRYSEGLHQAIEAKEGGHQGGEPDPGHYHPELLPALRQALG